MAKGGDLFVNCCNIDLDASTWLRIRDAVWAEALAWLVIDVRLPALQNSSFVPEVACGESTETTTSNSSHRKSWTAGNFQISSLDFSVVRCEGCATGLRALFDGVKASKIVFKSCRLSSDDILQSFRCFEEWSSLAFRNCASSTKAPMLEEAALFAAILPALEELRLYSIDFSADAEAAVAAFCRTVEKFAQHLRRILFRNCFDHSSAKRLQEMLSALGDRLPWLEFIDIDGVHVFSNEPFFKKLLNRFES